MDTADLADGGVLIYDPAFLPPEIADQYFVELRDHSQWEQQPAPFANLQPRLVAAYADEGVEFRYSGAVNVALPWTSTLLEIKLKIEAVYGKYNYCLLNLYRSGSDDVEWHTYQEQGVGNVTGSVSLGASRTFRIRHINKKKPMSLLLGNGTLVIMAGTMQQFWQHKIQKTKIIIGERINLTFKLIEKE